MKKKYSDEELKNATNKLHYEYWMMKVIRDIVISGIPNYNSKPEHTTNVSVTTSLSYSTGIVTTTSPTGDDTERYRVINNAIIESFGIHYRAILDFLYGNPTEDDDIMAVNYFATPNDWISLRPRIELRKKKERVNKEIVHITNTYGKPKIDWMFEDLLKEVMTTINLFVSKIHDNYLGDRWK